MIMNKSLATNFIALALIVMGYFLPVYSMIVMEVGFFAFSGSITNWLAVYMLFEKVPFLAGSGVIPNRFQEFKTAIRNLIMNEFFTEERLENTIEDLKSNLHIDISPLSKKVDHDKIFTGITKAVQESKFGTMISIFGGVQALEPLRIPLKNQTIQIVNNILSESEDEIKKLAQGFLKTTEIREKITSIINKRLDELTPEMIKEIVQKMIQEHLGWLVVWGGFFGGLIGLGMSLSKLYLQSK